MNNQCLHEKFKTMFDIGFDINADGEERQNLDICESCGAKRFWVKFISFDKGPEIHYNQWEENTKDNFWNAPIHFGRFN